MKQYALDTNCFINAANSLSTSYETVCRLLDAANRGELFLGVSLHTLHQLEVKNDEAWKIAKTLPEVPHWPIGTWDEQVGTWKQQCGTWDDCRLNDKIQEELNKLAKSGNDIRDRGAFIDALCANYDGFVTSDKQLVGSGPIKRINERFSTQVISPEDLVQELGI